MMTANIKRLLLGSALFALVVLSGFGGLNSAPTVIQGTLAATGASVESTVGTAPAAVPALAAVTGIVNGRVTNGTKDGKVPPSLTVTLHILDQTGNDTTRTTTTDAQGNFAFDRAPMSANNAYAVTTLYLDRQLTSQVVTGDPTGKTLSLPLHLYEPTGDPQVISIASMAIRLNISAAGLQVAQVIHVKNSSDRMFTADKAIAPNRYPSVSVTLPPGAVIQSFSDNTGRYVVSTDGLSFTDTTPVLPDEDHIVHYIFQMPYREEGTVVEQSFNYPVNGPVQVMIPPSSITLNSQQLPSQGLDTSGGTPLLTIGGTLSLKVGESLRYDLQGKVTGAQTRDQAAPFISRDLVIGLLIGGGFGFIGIGVIFLIRERRYQKR